MHRLFFHSENSARITDIPTSGPVSGQKPQLIKDGRRIKCSTGNSVPIVVPGLATTSSSSATPSSPTSVPQETVIPTLHPASTRSESTSSTVRGSPLHEPAETENTNKSGDNVTVQGNPLRDLPEWLQEFTKNLVDESFPAHGDAPASSSRESASRPRGKVVSGMHSIYTHSLPEGPKLRHLHEDQDNKGSLHKTHWRSRTSSRKIS